MDAKEIQSLIDYHKTGLNQYRQHMSPASQHLEEQTIIALKAYQESLVILEAKAILERRKGIRNAQDKV